MPLETINGIYYLCGIVVVPYKRTGFDSQCLLHSTQQPRSVLHDSACGAIYK
jgi:hypothetical protein